MTTVFLCRASGEGTHNFRVCLDEAAVMLFYEEMFGREQNGSLDMTLKHFRDPDNWSHEGNAYECELYCAKWEVWKVQPGEIRFATADLETPPPFIGVLRNCEPLDSHGVMVRASREAIDETLAYIATMRTILLSLGERLNHAVSLLSDTALTDDYDAEQLLREAGRISGDLATIGKTADWDILSSWYARLCEFCGVSAEDEINIAPLLEVRLKEIAALKDDAARFRWLRERMTVRLRPSNDVAELGWLVPMVHRLGSSDADAMSAAIDAAMKKPTEQK